MSLFSILHMNPWNITEEDQTGHFKIVFVRVM